MIRKRFLLLCLGWMMAAAMEASDDWNLSMTGAVPRMDIAIENGATVTSKEVYLKAYLTISGKGSYADFSDSTYIRGRGNSTWGYAKKPYRLKLFHKGQPFGLTAGKNWVLLANYLDPTLLLNAVAMKVARQVGVAYANHMVPVELYINGRYQGNYMFTEQVGVADNSVAIDSQKGTLLELDLNYDEPYRFISDNYFLPVMVKSPSLEKLSPETAEERFALIRMQFNAMERALLEDGNVEDYFEVEELVRYMLVYDLFCNTEVTHPKSLFLYKRDATNPQEKYRMGPVWDFDWCCGYNGNVYYQTFPELFSQRGETVPTTTPHSFNGIPFLYDLSHHPAVRLAYVRLWRNFLPTAYEELTDYISSYQRFAEDSFEHDATLWPRSKENAAAVVSLKLWLRARLEQMQVKLDSYCPSDVPMQPIEGAEVLSVRYLTLEGRGSLPSTCGVYLVETVYSDGRVVVEKRWGTAPQK